MNIFLNVYYFERRKMKVLFLTVYDFWNLPNNGSKVISKRNYEMLKSIYGDENLYYCGVEEGMEEYQGKNRLSISVSKNLFLRYYNYLFKRYRYNKKAEKKILKFIEEVDPQIIFFDGSLIGNILKKVRKEQVKAVIVFFHNIETNVALKAVTRNGRLKPYRFIRYMCNKSNEKFIAQNSNYRICMNSRDSKLLKKYHKEDVDFYLPTTIIDKYDEAKYKETIVQPNTLLFVGSYFSANCHGLNWFITNVLSYIECKLMIVGSGMEKYVPPIKNEKIKIYGEVEDLGEYYMSSMAVVCPIFLGDGMKTKTAEAMMYGKTIFATDEALQGYEVENIRNIYRCNDAKQFINNINTYFMNSDITSCNQNIRRCFLEKYEFNFQYRAFNEWMKKWLEKL